MKQIKYIQLIRNKIIVGKCKLEINNNIAWLENVFIYKKFRGSGYSKLLIRKAINLMKRMKIEIINLHVKYDNYIAIKTYKNSGFKIIRKNYEKKELFGYTMTLSLK
jgi:ribosomal protein S18 acetylase RimI-like enzyme